MTDILLRSNRIISAIGYPETDFNNPSLAVWGDAQLRRKVDRSNKGVIEKYSLKSPGLSASYTFPNGNFSYFRFDPDNAARFDELTFEGQDPKTLAILGVLATAPPAIIVRRPTLSELPAVQQLRHKILDPARKVKTDETMGPEYFDPSFVQLAAFCGKNVVATARFGPLPNDVCKVNGVATADGLRRQGLASKVMIVGEKIARLQGASSFTLDSRKGSIPFYESLGYKLLTGECVTEEDDVPNFTMTKQVK